MASPSLDPVSVAIAIATALFGAALGPALGAYAVIFVAGFAGALVGLRRREPTSRFGAASFMLVVMLLSVGMTVAASQLIAPHLNSAGEWLFFPVSFVIAAIGEDWLRIGAWAVGLIGRFAQRKAGD